MPAFYTTKIKAGGVRTKSWSKHSGLDFVRTPDPLKRHDDEVQSHEQRTSVMGKKPGQLWDRLVFALIDALATGIAGAVIWYTDSRK